MQVELFPYPNFFHKVHPTVTTLSVTRLVKLGSAGVRGVTTLSPIYAGRTFSVSQLFSQSAPNSNDTVCDQTSLSLLAAGQY
ncbi:hypothetical protein T11_1645 [Trichinella zimbabwensis]|uniref:Uncharacterized protein n=1 Tax=Trichinella zimbabwensis TaxID=268475 RepID=A0A0V1GF74_9BILA|nr:hypothetical protein T11_1645 [Trichinella zimbabwensis]